MPALSVVMPVLNGGAHLDEAVGSILAQSFSDFEFVILDDGSTDGTREKLRAWAQADRRIRLLEGARSIGPAGSSNAVVGAAVAPLIARMDADDRSRPERLAEQRQMFDRHPDLVLLGTLASTIDAEGRQVRAPDYARLLRRSPFAPFAHSSIMFRKEAFERVGGYRPAANKWEDVDLFIRLAEAGSAMVLGRPLLEYRQWERSSRISDGSEALEEAMDLMYRCLAEYRAGGAFDRLLVELPAPRKLHPESFVAAAGRLVWTGHPPRVSARLLRRAALRLDRASLAALIWSAWADLSPRSLRLALRGLLALRNVRARHALAGRSALPWRPQDARHSKGRLQTG